MERKPPADDPTRYRDPAEVEAWRAKDPIVRFQKFLTRRDLLNEDRVRQIVEEVKEEVNEAVQIAEAMPPMAPGSFFDYTSATLSPRLQEQRADLLRYVDREAEHPINVVQGLNLPHHLGVGPD